MSYGTRGVSLDYCSLSRNGFDSSKKVITKTNYKPLKRKNLSAELTKEDLGFWNDPSGVEFVKNFHSFSMDSQGDHDTSLSKQHKVESSDNEEKDKINSTSSSQATVGSENVNPGDSVYLHAEKDSELDSNTSSPQVSQKIRAKNTRSIKTATKALTQVAKTRKKAVDSELKAKQEEFKLLKNEHDLLEYEVTQTEKLKDSIDKFQEKIRALKKRKSGEKKLKVKQVDSEDDAIIISPTQPFSAKAFNELKSRVGFACHEILKQTGLSGLIHENDLIADLLQ